MEYYYDDGKLHDNQREYTWDEVFAGRLYKRLVVMRINEFMLLVDPDQAVIYYDDVIPLDLARSVPKIVKLVCERPQHESAIRPLARLAYKITAWEPTEQFLAEFGNVTCIAISQPYVMPGIGQKKIKIYANPINIQEILEALPGDCENLSIMYNGTLANRNRRLLLRFTQLQKLKLDRPKLFEIPPNAGLVCKFRSDR